MDVLFDFAIIGGDKRLSYMYAALTDKGSKVIAYGLPDEKYAEADSLGDAVTSSKCIICPIPFTRDGQSILSQNKQDDLNIESLKNILTSSNLLFAGCIPESLTDFCNKNNIFVYDYMKNEELTIYNTIATAEGAIAEAINYQPTNLHGSNCIVLGYGRCAKTLAHKLKGLSANVTVCARSSKALAEADAYGFNTLMLDRIISNINKFEYIFNTIPDIVLDEDALSHVKKDALLIDIAPGGFDFSKAGEIGINARMSLGLPGKYAPRASGQLLADITLAVSESIASS